MVRSKQEKPLKGTNAIQNSGSNLSSKKRKNEAETSLDLIKKTKPLFQDIDDFIENNGYFQNHYVSYLSDMSEKPVPVWERQNGLQELEMIEIYRELEETDIDLEVKTELEQCLLEATQKNKTELIQSIKNQLLKC